MIFILLYCFAYLKYASAYLNPTLKNARYNFATATSQPEKQSQNVNFLIIDLTGVPWKSNKILLKIIS